MIIDAHGHYTTAPAEHAAFWQDLMEADGSPRPTPAPSSETITDDQIRDSLEPAQLRLQRERGTDLTVFSPGAAAMNHHLGSETTAAAWAASCNDLIYRACQLYPGSFAPAAMLPQSPGTDPARSVPELRRCVEELGFVGCNLNPDPSGGHWPGPPVTDKSWYPLYEALAELDVPAMIHVSRSCNPHFQTTGAYYLAADTAIFMQLLESQLFRVFPTLRLIIPHGGGAVPYHWGRFRGLALDRGLGELDEFIGENLFFDTCVYHEPGVRLLTEVVPPRNILFASEMVGAVRGTDPATGYYFDDTKRYIDAQPGLSGSDRAAIFEHNARRIFSRLAGR